MPPSADELRELQQKAVQSVENGPGQRVLDAEAVGLSKRDYVPLAVALFVDLCLLLVSMGRPVNRLGGLMPRMQAAERSPVSTILSRFNDIHRDPDIRQTFEVFRHVVFDQGGVYYVAVPLDAPFTMGRRGAPGAQVPYGSQDAQELQHEAHLLANLFTSFEKERIFARVHSPLLTTGTVQKKLARQGSKFAGCRAFRIYRFRDGAWQEIILGAVMGAAKRAEDQRAAEARDVTARPDGVTEAPRRTRRVEDAPTMRAADVGSPEEARFAAGHGPYARAAQDELSIRPEREAHIEVRAANSNTMPASRGAASAERTASDDTPPTVVPLRPRAPAGPHASLDGDADRAAAPVPVNAEATAPAEGMVDIVMRRETASFRVPVSQATLPVTLFSTAGNLAEALPVFADEAVPTPAIEQIAAAIDTSTDDQQELFELNDFEVAADEDVDGLAALAGRLRPALPRG
jgi:hypothetical protein